MRVSKLQRKGETMSLLSDLLTNEGGQEAKVAKPLVVAKADRERMEGVSEMLPAICDALGITGMPEIKPTDPNFDTLAKARAELIGNLVAAVLRGAAEGR